MKTTTLACTLFLALGISACDKKDDKQGKGKSAKGGGPSCDKVFDHMTSFAKAKGKKFDPKDVAETKAAFMKTCAVIAAKTKSCMLAAKSGEAAMKCMEAEKNNPAFKKYIAKGNTAEARVFVKKLYDGARTYFMDRPASRGMQPIPPQFPAPSQGPTPPLGTCCKTPDKKCKPDASQWTSPVWTALMFSVDDPHYYSYSYIVNGKTFTVRANGDLDCDGVYSTYELTGVVDDKHPDGPAGNAKMKIVKPLE